MINYIDYISDTTVLIYITLPFVHALVVHTLTSSCSSKWCHDCSYL